MSANESSNLSPVKRNQKGKVRIHFFKFMLERKGFGKKLTKCIILNI